MRNNRTNTNVIAALRRMNTFDSRFLLRNKKLLPQHVWMARASVLMKLGVNLPEKNKRNTEQEDNFELKQTRRLQ